MLEAEIGRISVESPFTRYKEHALEVINSLRQKLDRVQTSESKRLKEFYFYQIDTGIRWFLIQHRIFKTILESSSDKRWAALRNFVYFYSQQIGLKTSPLPFFGEEYYSSGSFPYYRTLALRLEKEYYVLCVDHTDPPVFWPLALHEIAHCWLSNRDDVDQICGRHLPDLRRIDKDTAENRVEEALCDVVATCLIGPAYPYAFVTKLWAQFPVEVSSNYPSYRYRVECMASILDRQGFCEEAADLRDIGEGKSEHGWREEEISWSLDDLQSVADEVPSPSATEVKRLARGASTDLELSAPSDPASLFYAAWLSLDRADPKNTANTTDKMSQAIIRVLERRSMPSDT